jgi:hypothetical protein
MGDLGLCRLLGEEALGTLENGCEEEEGLSGLGNS